MEAYLSILMTMNQIRINGVAESEHETKKFVSNLKAAQQQIIQKPNQSKQECDKIYQDHFLMDSAEQMQQYQEMQIKMESDYTTTQCIVGMKLSKIATEQKKISKLQRCDFKQIKKDLLATAVSNVATPPTSMRTSRQRPNLLSSRLYSTNRNKLIAQPGGAPSIHHRSNTAAPPSAIHTPMKYHDGFAVPLPSNHKKRVVQKKTNRTATRNSTAKFNLVSPRNRRMAASRSPTPQIRQSQQSIVGGNGGSLSQPTIIESRPTTVKRKIDSNHSKSTNSSVTATPVPIKVASAISAPQSVKSGEPPSSKRRRIDDGSSSSVTNTTDEVISISEPVIVFSSGGDSGDENDSLDPKLVKMDIDPKFEKMDIDPKFENGELCSQLTNPSADTSFTSFVSFTDDSTAPTPCGRGNRPRPSHKALEQASRRNSDFGLTDLSDNADKPMMGEIPPPVSFTSTKQQKSISPIKITEAPSQSQPSKLTNSNLVLPNLSTAASFIPDIPNKAKKDEKKKIRVPALEQAARQREKQLRKEAERKAQRDAMKTKKNIRILQKKSQKKDDSNANSASTVSSTVSSSTMNPKSTKKVRLIRTMKPSNIAKPKSSMATTNGNRLSKIKLKSKLPPKMSTIKKPKIVSKPHRSIKKVKKKLNMASTYAKDSSKAKSPPTNNAQPMWISAQNVNNKENLSPPYPNSKANPTPKHSKKKDKFAKISDRLQTSAEYQLSDYDSEFTESDMDEDACVKHIPDWARHKCVTDTVRSQSTIDPDRIYGKMTYKSCDLEDIFKNYPAKPKYRQRTASGDWTRDRVTYIEEHEYKRTMGWA